MSNNLFYFEKRAPLPEKRLYTESLTNWLRTIAQRHVKHSHRRVSQVQVQGLASILTQTLQAPNSAGLSYNVILSQFVTVAETCRLAAVTIDYIMQGRLTDFTGNPARITGVANDIQAHTGLYSRANAANVWMLIAPPDSRTGDWTSFVAPNAARVVQDRADELDTFLSSLASSAALPNQLKETFYPGAFLVYCAYQSLLDNPAQFFRLVSDTELVSTTAAMAERRRGLMRVAAAMHALTNLPLTISINMVKQTFERLDGFIGPLPIAQSHKDRLAEFEIRYSRGDVFNSMALASKVIGWLDDSAESNLLGMYSEILDELTDGVLSVSRLNVLHASATTPTGAPTAGAPPFAIPTTTPSISLSAYASLVATYVVTNVRALSSTMAATAGGLNTSASPTEFFSTAFATTPLSPRVTQLQRFLLTGLPILGLSVRYDVSTVLMVIDRYINAMNLLTQNSSGQDEVFISPVDKTELGTLFSFEDYFKFDRNPWLAATQRQNGPNIQQDSGGKAIYTSTAFGDIVATPAIDRDFDEIDLPLVLPGRIARSALSNPVVVHSDFQAYWDESLRTKVAELITPVGPTLLPVQAFPSRAGIKRSRLVGNPVAPSGDTIRDYIARATGLGGRYLAIALTVPGTRRRLATLASSFGVFYIRNNFFSSDNASDTAAPPNMSIDSLNADYTLVVGDGLPYGLVDDDYDNETEAATATSYSLLSDCCGTEVFPIVQGLVYFRLIRYMPSRRVGRATGSWVSTESYASGSMSAGRRYVVPSRRATTGVRSLTSARGWSASGLDAAARELGVKDSSDALPASMAEVIDYFVEAPPMIHFALLPGLARFGTPPTVLISRTHAYTLETTAVLTEGSPTTESNEQGEVNRYTTWNGISLDRLALHGEMPRIVPVSAGSNAVEMAMEEAAKLNAAAEEQLKASLAVAATPVSKTEAVEAVVRDVTTKEVKKDPKSTTIAK